MSLDDLLARRNLQGGGAKALSPKEDKPVNTEKKFTLYSDRPNLAFFVDSVTRVKFDGNYLHTDDEAIKDFAVNHYGEKFGVVIVEKEVKEPVAT